jgi:DNA-binding NarL/FixJ family response regulator
MYNVLIVEDHKIISDSLSKLLETHEEIGDIKCAESIESALTLLKEEDFDVVSLDLNLGMDDGIDLLSEIRNRYEELPVLILSMKLTPSVVAEAVAFNVNGFVDKALGISSYTKALVKVAKGGTFFSDNADIALREHIRESKNLTNELNQRELEIISCLSQEMTTAEIAEKLDISKRTVDTHKVNIMKKLDVKNAIGIVMKAIKHGLIDIT